jgi:hypothetical protein
MCCVLNDWPRGQRFARELNKGAARTSTRSRKQATIAIWQREARENCEPAMLRLEYEEEAKKGATLRPSS